VPPPYLASMIREGYPPGFVDVEGASAPKEPGEEEEEEEEGKLRFICGGQEMDVSDSESDANQTDAACTPSRSHASGQKINKVRDPRKAVMTVVFPGAFGAPPPPGVDASLWDFTPRVHVFQASLQVQAPLRLPVLMAPLPPYFHLVQQRTAAQTGWGYGQGNSQQRGDNGGGGYNGRVMSLPDQLGGGGFRVAWGGGGRSGGGGGGRGYVLAPHTDYGRVDTGFESQVQGYGIAAQPMHFTPTSASYAIAPALVQPMQYTPASSLPPSRQNHVDAYSNVYPAAQDRQSSQNQAFHLQAPVTQYQDGESLRNPAYHANTVAAQYSHEQHTHQWVGGAQTNVQHFNHYQSNQSGTQSAAPQWQQVSSQCLLACIPLLWQRN